MHSSESVQPAAGPTLLLQLGRLIIRARSSSPSPLTKHKHPSTSQQVHIQTQPKVDEEDSRLEANLSSHVEALWADQIPVCVEVLLGPSCSECFATMTRSEPAALRGLLLERWTMTAVLDKSESPSVISSPWLLNAIRSQLHFSQLSAWRARLQPRHERRRKLSHEKCNYKKIESNLNESKMNIIYSIKTPGEKTTDFARPPTDHTFPLTDIGNNKYLKVVLESLPRIDDIPEVKCACRRSSKDFSAEDLVGRLSDLSIGSRKYDGAINSNIGTPSRRLSIITNPESTEYLFTVKDKLVDDRMHTPCNENGKHKCNCDDESDDKVKNQPKKLDERRIKEIAKYKRRIRKEKRICDSTSSEGDVKVKETTSIPILQASRFDRFRAIGCYRNQTYLTLPASRIETKSPFIDTEVISPPVFKKTNTVATQTDFACPCGNIIDVTKCESCVRGMVRSDGNYNLASLSENGARRKLDDDGEKSIKKLKCDNNVSSLDIIKRPKLKRLFPIIDKLDMIVTDRNHINEKDMKDLHLMTDDSVFSTPKMEVKNDGPKHQPESNHVTDELIKTHHTNGSCLDHTSNGPITHEDGCLNHADEVNLQLKSDRCLNQDRYSHRIDGPNCLHQTTNGSCLNPRTDESSHPTTNRSNLYSRTTGSSLQSTTDEPSLQPTTDGPSLHPKTDGLRLNPYIDGYSLHPQADGSNGLNPTDDHHSKPKESKRQKTYSISDDDYVLYEKCDYGTIDTHDREIDSPIEEQPDFKFSIPERSEQQNPDQIESLQDEFIFPDPKRSEQVPSSSEMDRFRWRFDSAASMVFHTKTGLPLTSSPAPLRRGNNCFDFDDSINGISGIKSALFHEMPPAPAPPACPASPPPAPRRPPRPRMASSTGLLGSFEESALQGRLEAVATVHGFTAELGASGAFCPPHKRLPVTVFFYAPGGTAAPYMGHINLGPGGYRVSRSGTVQVSLFNPHGTLVKMFVVLYDLSRMPRAATTFLRQRTLYVPAATRPGDEPDRRRCLRYLIHLRFMTSKTGKLYLHTDIRLIVSRKADLDTAAAHSALIRPPLPPPDTPEGEKKDRAPNRVFGGSSEHDSESPEIGYDNVSYELRSFTYAPDNPKYSPR